MWLPDSVVYGIASQAVCLTSQVFSQKFYYDELRNMFSAAFTLTGVEHVMLLLLFWLYVSVWLCDFDIASNASQGISLGAQIPSPTVLEEWVIVWIPFHYGIGYEKSRYIYNI